MANCGLTSRVFYGSKGHPAEQTIREFVNSVPILQWADRNPTTTELRIRNVWNRFNKFIFTPPLPGWQKSRHRRELKPRILLQTHLDGHHGLKGLSAKCWTVDAWAEVIIGLVRNYQAEIHLLEWHDSSRTQLLSCCPQVVDARQPALLQQCLHLQSMDLVISVDSWTKYPARWAQIPQIVIVPDLRRNYTSDFEQMNASRVISGWFAGIACRADTILIGIAHAGRGWEWTLPSMDDLAPEDILRSAGRLINIGA